MFRIYNEKYFYLIDYENVKLHENIDKYVNFSKIVEKMNQNEKKNSITLTTSSSTKTKHFVIEYLQRELQIKSFLRSFQIQSFLRLLQIKSFLRLFQMSFLRRAQRAKNIIKQTHTYRRRRHMKSLLRNEFVS